jgi:hypothetical protein
MSFGKKVAKKDGAGQAAILIGIIGIIACLAALALTVMNLSH